jgi:PPOX class probable F420-dependent enzyme
MITHLQEMITHLQELIAHSQEESQVADGLTSWAREILERPETFGTLGTIASDGSPHQAVIWFGIAGDSILVNSLVGRRWPSNLLRDPRYSFLVGNGYEWVSLRGRAEAFSDPEQAQADIAAMSRRYHADDPARADLRISRFKQQDRISFLLHPAAVTEHPDD